MGFYIGKSVFGVFVPVKGLGIGNSVVTARFYSSGSRVGNISLVKKTLMVKIRESY